MTGVDFTRYTPPGVYVEDASSPVITPVGVPDGTVCVIGPSLGYQTATEVVSAYSQTANLKPLANRGVFVTAVTGPPAIAAPKVTRSTGAVMVFNVDYTWDVDTSGGSGAAAIARLKRIANDADPTNPAVPSTNGLVDGEAVVVTYNYADPTYYQPTVFEDITSVTQRYGQPMIGTLPGNPNANQIVSPLTLGAKLALDNGAAEVLCIPLDPTAGTFKQQFQAAYAKVESDYRAQFIAPIFIDAWTVGSSTTDTHTASAALGLIEDLRLHCTNASLNGYGRIGFAGLARAYEENVTPVNNLALTIASKRIVLAYPNRLLLTNPSNNSTSEVDGCFLAAGMAGALASQVPARGLTQIIMRGFSGLPASIITKMTRQFKNTLSSSGVAVVEIDRSQRLIVRHGVTTDMSGLTTREVSLVRTADSLFESVQIGMENAGLIGEPIDDEMVTQVKGALIGILEQNVIGGVIISYDNVLARQQTLPAGDPTIIECQFQYRPAVPLNYITVIFSIDLTTGEQSLTELGEAA